MKTSRIWIHRGVRAVLEYLMFLAAVSFVIAVLVA